MRPCDRFAGAEEVDDANAARVLELLVQRTRAHGTALLLVTHDRRVSGLLDDQVDLDGLR